jgi:hypothetical protein
MLSLFLLYTTSVGVSASNSGGHAASSYWHTTTKTIYRTTTITKLRTTTQTQTSTTFVCCQTTTSTVVTTATPTTTTTTTQPTVTDTTTSIETVTTTTSPNFAASVTGSGATGGPGAIFCDTGNTKDFNFATISFSAALTDGIVTGGSWSIANETGGHGMSGHFSGGTATTKAYSLTGLQEFDSLCATNPVYTSITIFGNCGSGLEIKFTATNGEVAYFDDSGNSVTCT